MQDDKSCLHVACERGDTEVIESLCDHGGKELLMMTGKVILYGKGLIHLFIASNPLTAYVTGWKVLPTDCF